jgi:NAD(P)H-dependent flavin oxidoreductase YrpB (nitropropane dioxygenase family)
VNLALKPALRTPLCDLLGCEYPVVQTAMGWVSDARLVAATSNGGGFGFLAGATIEPDLLEAEILQLKSLTPHRFGLNFHMWQPNAKQVIDLVIRHSDRIRAVSYGRGPDKATIRRFKDAGVLCMPTVGAVKHAVKAIEMGADVVTVQGGEGGGHTGSVPTSILLPQVLDAVSVPVVAAGGFHDGRGLAAALAYGAVGIAMGTRFLMTSDSPVPDATKSHYVAVNDTAKIRVSYAVDGMPQRHIDNPYLLHLEAASGLGRVMTALQCAWKWKARTGMTTAFMVKTAIRALREDGMSVAQTLMAANAPVVIQRSIVEGRPEEGVLPSGQVAAVIGELQSCAEVIDGIVRQARARLDALAALQLQTGQAIKI